MAGDNHAIERSLDISIGDGSQLLCGQLPRLIEEIVLAHDRRIRILFCDHILDSHDLLEIVLDTDPQAYLIPAHIWTPWFAILGSKSGFDTITDCFAELTPHIFALETGLDHGWVRIVPIVQVAIRMDPIVLRQYRNVPGLYRLE